MKIIYCCDPQSNDEPDAMYLDEVGAATRAGLSFALIHYETLTEGSNAARAVRHIPVQQPETTGIYRGWPLRVDQYAALYDALLSRGIQLINTAAQFKHTEYLPEALPIIQHKTPQTVWIESDGRVSHDALMQLLIPFAGRPLILRDFARMEKHYWGQACYIPSSSDPAAVQNTVDYFLYLRGKHLEGGLVFREFVEFEVLTDAPSRRHIIAMKQERPAWEVRVIKCTKCGHENHDNAQICDVCGTLLVQPKWGPARFTGSLILDVVETDRRFVLPADEIDNLVLGRRDPATGEAPRIDLTDVDAVEKGVSRQHAVIRRVENGALAIIDNNSANGTFLNGHRLVPLQPRILRHGDDIRLGHLTMRITFEGNAQPQYGMPLVKEYRIVYLNHRPIAIIRYWNFEGYDTSHEPDLNQFGGIARQIRSPFFTMDVARRVDGEWLIIDLGDAQIAHLPLSADLDAFYRSLAGAQV